MDNSITDLKILIESMSPSMHEFPYAMISVNEETFNFLDFQPLCIFREEEGITIITEESNAVKNKYDYTSTWACITLNVHSSLSAVGFIAAIAGRLTDANISINPVSAFYHDHLFVPWEKRYNVMEILNSMSKGL